MDMDLEHGGQEASGELIDLSRRTLAQRTAIAKRLLSVENLNVTTLLKDRQKAILRRFV